MLVEKLWTLGLYAPDKEGGAGAGSGEGGDGGAGGAGGGKGDGQGAGGEDGGDGAGGDGKPNPLLPDLQKWKGKARTLEQENAQLKKDLDAAKAGSKEELQAVHAKHTAELSARERRLRVSELGNDAQVGRAFLAQAMQEADGDDSPEEIVEKAKGHQAAFLKSHGAAAGDGDGAGGEGSQRFGGKGGASPEKGGKRIWTAAEIEAVNPLDTKLNEEVALAIAEGRVKR